MGMDWEPIAAAVSIFERIGGVSLQALQAIAVDTLRDFHATTAPNQMLRQFFVEQLVSSLRGFSPQLVAYRRGVSGSEETTEDFSIGDTVKQVVFKLSRQRGRSFDFRIEKDGLDVTSLGKVRQGPFYRILALDLPAKFQGHIIKPGGKWHMRIRGKKDAAYEAAVIVDETKLKYDLAFGSGFYRAGEALDLKLHIFAEGRPVSDNLQVTATVLRIYSRAPGRRYDPEHRPQDRVALHYGRRRLHRRSIEIRFTPTPLASFGQPFQ
jgi:hypothetical protein